MLSAVSTKGHIDSTDRSAPRGCAAAALVATLLLPGILFAQAAQEHIVVPERQTHTDVKGGPSSGSIVLALIPKGTVLPVIGRRGEWLQVRLSPELRRRSVPMRWYKNEEAGFVHESTVQVVKGNAPAAPPALPPIDRTKPHIRVPDRQTHTDVKAGAGSGSIVLMLIPSGTELPIVGRRGEWIQVKLSPELRGAVIPMRWYKNEDAGFVHESTVDVIGR
jgi:hypothetical protein